MSASNSYKMHSAALITGVKSDSKSDSVVRARRMFVLKVRVVPPLIENTNVLLLHCFLVH